MAPPDHSFDAIFPLSNSDEPEEVSLDDEAASGSSRGGEEDTSRVQTSISQRHTTGVECDLIESSTTASESDSSSVSDSVESIDNISLEEKTIHATPTGNICPHSCASQFGLESCSFGGVDKGKEKIMVRTKSFFRGKKPIVRATDKASSGEELSDDPEKYQGNSMTMKKRILKQKRRYGIPNPSPRDIPTFKEVIERFPTRHKIELCFKHRCIACYDRNYPCCDFILDAKLECSFCRTNRIKCVYIVEPKAIPLEKSFSLRGLTAIECIKCKEAKPNPDVGNPLIKELPKDLLLESSLLDEIHRAASFHAQVRKHQHGDKLYHSLDNDMLLAFGYLAEELIRHSLTELLMPTKSKVNRTRGGYIGPADYSLVPDADLQMRSLNKVDKQWKERAKNWLKINKQPSYPTMLKEDELEESKVKSPQSKKKPKVEMNKTIDAASTSGIKTRACKSGRPAPDTSTVDSSSETSNPGSPLALDTP